MGEFQTANSVQLLELVDNCRISTAKNDLHPMHPLESAEANVSLIFSAKYELKVIFCVHIATQFAVNREARLFQTLRDTQGLHAPLRLQMERKLTAGVSYDY